MRLSIITIFPTYFDSAFELGIISRAVEAGAVDLDVIDLRQWGKGLHRQVDDAPFGGGAGMVMMPEPMADALDTVQGSHRVFLTPAGTPMTQGHLDRFAELDHLTLICGRYEGLDQRVIDHMVDEEVSLGDFVISGGEAAALTVIEGVVRLLPGVLGNEESIVHESFRDGQIEEPQYTRPAEFRGWKVPDVLRSGDHGAIEQWRATMRNRRTSERRPDLLNEDT